jgi:hypothetical protein
LSWNSAEEKHENTHLRDLRIIIMGIQEELTASFFDTEGVRKFLLSQNSCSVGRYFNL